MELGNEEEKYSVNGFGNIKMRDSENSEFIVGKRRSQW